MEKQLTEQQIRKKAYNKKYLEKIKEKAIQQALQEKKEETPEANTDKDNDADFFFQDSKDKKHTSATPMTPQMREPVPVVIQQTTAPLKQKLLETLALTAISMLPLLIKHLVFFKSSTPSSETRPPNTQQLQTNESANFSAGMNLW